MSGHILFICGSLNQTTMMHKIAKNLGDFNCTFTPFYADGFLGLLARWGVLNFTILGGRHKKNTEKYFIEQNLQVDFGGKARDYDLVVTCTDTLVQKNIRGKRMILVQEGMIEPEGLMYWLVRYLKLPRWLANTATTGLSDKYDVFCVASEGYRRLFTRRGVRPEKIIVTGIPNFDDAEQYLENDFPLHGFVLAATSSARETFQKDDRIAFIENARKIATDKGKQLIFKLHPNENIHRAKKEIRKYAPEAVIYEDGNLNHMVANCDILLTQYTSAVYIGIALGKETYSYFNIKELRRLKPIQNQGSSAAKIAEIARQLIYTPLSERYKVLAKFKRRSRMRAFDVS
jgi:hypothetical protein